MWFAHFKGSFNPCIGFSVPAIGIDPSVDFHSLELVTDDLIDADCSKEEILAALSHLKPRKSASPGAEIGESLKSSVHAILPFAHFWHNLTHHFLEAYFQPKWKKKPIIILLFFIMEVLKILTILCESSF